MKSFFRAIVWFTTAACPIAVAAATGLPGVMLAWEPSPGADVVGYRVYYGTSSFSYTNRVEVTNSFVTGHATNAVVPNLLPGGKYYFAATAFDGYGQESDFSNEVTYDTPADDAPVPSITLQAGAINLLTPGSVTFITRIELPGHYIKGVDVLANGQSLRQYHPGGSARGAYSYKVVWNDIGNGDYSLKARVLYDFAGVSESETFTFSVTGSPPEVAVQPSNSTVSKTRLSFSSAAESAEEPAYAGSGNDELGSAMSSWVESGPSFSAALQPLLHHLVVAGGPIAQELARHVVRRYWPRFPDQTRQAVETLPPGPRREELLGIGEELAESARSFSSVIRYHPDLERTLMADVVRRWYLLDTSRALSWVNALPEGPARRDILVVLGRLTEVPGQEPL